MEKTYIIALHGFLGCPTDWEKIIIQPNVDWIKPDLFSDSEWGAGCSLEQAYGCIFNQAKILKKSGRVLIAGYSMGGRLALGALALDIEGDIFDGALLISVNPGLENQEEKLKRIESDNLWSEKILSVRTELDWEAFLNEWNSQSVFTRSNTEPQRQLYEFNLTNLASAMKNSSLGLQTDFRKNITTLKTTILWITGEQDTKFVNIAKKMNEFTKNNLNFKTIVVSNSGHRVIFDQPIEFSKILIEFINILSPKAAQNS